MSYFRSHLARRLPALLVLITLFTVGSNYCLLSAWGGNTAMDCLTLPRDGAGSPVPSCHRVPSAPKSQPGHEPAGKRSCCPDPVLIAVSPTLEKALAAVTAPVASAVLTPVAAPRPELILAGHDPPAPPDDPPPTHLLCAPLPARAPPLA